jgi:uncharacterized protein (TIGR02246 family)
MKKQNFLLVSMLGCALAAPVLAAESPKAEKAGEEPKVKASEELRAIVRQHHDALNKQDLKALMALYADTPNVALMGTGPGEFWKGKAVIEDAYKHFFETFKAGSLKHDCPDVSGHEEGNNAWLMVSCVMKDSDPSGQPREFGLNVSAVLKKEKAGWRVQALHTSNASDEGGAPPEDAAPAAAPAPAPEAAPKKTQ